MKKNLKRLRDDGIHHPWVKIIIAMKLSVILVLMIFTQAFASKGYSQKTLLNLKMRNATVKEVLSEIEDNSEFYFLYNVDLIDVDRIVSINVNDKKIEEVLNLLFSDGNVNFVIKDRQIVLSPLSYAEGKVKAEPAKLKISGQITDTNGQPLPGVTVLVKGTTQGTITDADGNYSLSDVPEDATLKFSFVGMKTQEIPVAGKSSIDVILAEDAIGIEEVVAIGYGTIKKRDLTGSVASVEGTQVAERRTVKVSQALQGAMPGLTVTRTGSDADASATIRIRGITTISDSSPLVIVDGVPGTLDWVNPNDIENITILKDAASASIYGSRAASGVILITTKRAKAGQLDLTYNFEYGIDTPTRRPGYSDVVTYMKMKNEKAWIDGGFTGSEYGIYSENLINNYASLHTQDPDQYPDTDWQDLVWNDYATSQSHKLVLTAGRKGVRTKVSMDYNQNDALYDGRDYERFTFRANNDVDVNDYLSVAIDINGLYAIDERPVYDPAPGPLGGPVYAAEWSDGRVAPGLSGNNVYALMKYGGFNKTKTNAFGGKVSIDYSPIKALKITGVISPGINFSSGKEFITKVGYTDYTDPDNIIGYLNEATKTSLDELITKNYSITSQLFGTFTQEIGKHNFNVMAGYEDSYNLWENVGASRDYYDMTSFPYLDQGNENYQYNSGSATEYAYRSLFGRLMYNYDNKYFLQANIRYDGSSRFQKDYRWGFFPSFSAGWVVSQENFMKDVSALSYLKLRASWGTLGNERIGSLYPYQSTIGFGSTGVYYGSQAASIQTAAVSTYAVENITWETTESFDIGLDVNFLDNKLLFTGDYFKKVTKDMLLEVEVPDYIGLENPSQNAGKMHTTGWELQVGWRDEIGDIRYSVSANISDYKSVMGDLKGTEFLGSQIKREGSEYNEWYGYKTDGLFQTQEDIDNSPVLNSAVQPGDVKLLDISGPDGVPDGEISADYDRTLLGGSLPRYLYGGNISLGYKNFSFSMVFQGVGKQNSYMNSTYRTRPFVNGG